MSPIDSSWLTPRDEPTKTSVAPTPEPAPKPDPKPAPAAKKHRVAKPATHRKATASNYFRANQGFATVLDGEPLFVAKGELVHKDHPLLKRRESMFDPAENFGRFDVEQATAAPGEKR